MPEESSTTATFSGPAGEGEYVVQQGESVVSIAKHTGHHWRTIWDHPNNSALRQSRENPNILLPGDRLHIPEIELSTADCATDQRHRFRRRGEPVTLKVIFRNRGEPRANEPYSAAIAGRVITDTLDEEGRMTLRIPSDCRHGSVRVGEAESADTYELLIHLLNPANHESGLQQRLSNLGYPCNVSGEIDEQTHLALEEYRKKHQQAASGPCDDATKDQITQEHDNA